MSQKSPEQTTADLLQSQISKVLAAFTHPTLQKDLHTLRAIHHCALLDNVLHIELVMPFAWQYGFDALKESVSGELLAVTGATAIDWKLSHNITTLKRANDQPGIKGVRNIVAVSSGKGGVGKSSTAVNLALALAEEGAKVGILDADIYGPSIPLMFGAEGLQPTITPKDGKNYINPIKQYGIKMISIGFLTPPDSAVVWRGPMASQALKQFFGDTDWGELDYLLIDLPPGTSDIHLTLVQTVPVTGAVIVTTPQKVAIADANKGLAMFRQPQINVPILGVIENMAYFTPAELPDNKYYIFGQGGGVKLAEKYQVPFLGQIPLVQSIREAGDEGRPAVMDTESVVTEAFRDAAEALAQQVAIRNAGVEKTKVVEMRM